MGALFQAWLGDFVSLHYWFPVCYPLGWVNITEPVRSGKSYIDKKMVRESGGCSIHRSA